LVNNITVLSPGSSVGYVPTGTGSTTILDGNSITDLFAAGGIRYGEGSSGCGHNANCAFTNNSAQLKKLAGSGKGCNTQAVLTPQGARGGTQINSTNWSYAFLFLYYPSGGDGATVTSTEVDSIVIP
jgi:hypothetical protein